MLVVTAIVSITAAATMPTILTFRSKGRAVLCQNNLRNLVIAFNLYMHSNFKGFIGQDCGEGPKGGLQLEPQS
jgi:type II secretory pathway pseudopilin PulG